MLDKYKEDLNYFIERTLMQRTEVKDKIYPNERRHIDFYFSHSKEEMNNLINNYLSKNKIEDDNSFYYFLSLIIKYMIGDYDSHTLVFPENQRILPLKIRFIDGNVYIETCLNSNFNKAKILEINNISIDIILKELEMIICYQTEGWLYTQYEDSIIMTDKLLSLPSINKNSQTITFKTDKGNITYEVNKKYEFKINIPEDRIILKDDILIFKYLKCREEFVPNIDEIDRIIKNNNIKKFVLDLRGNRGGNSNLINSLIEYLKNSNLKLVTLVDKKVFSSGLFACVDMKRIGSKIVGEEIGTTINHFGYNLISGILPNTRLFINFSKVYWYLDDETYKIKGIYTRSELHRNNSDFFKPKRLILDKIIKYDIKDFLNNKNDFVLDKCINYINNI